MTWRHLVWPCHAVIAKSAIQVADSGSFLQVPFVKLGPIATVREVSAFSREYALFKLSSSQS